MTAIEFLLASQNIPFAVAIGLMLMIAAMEGAGALLGAGLSDLLDRLESKQLILIDTEGMSQRDMELSNRLAAYGTNANRVHFYLTLSAASQEAGLDETIRRFSKVPLAGAVVSKIDEAGGPHAPAAMKPAQ